LIVIFSSPWSGERHARTLASCNQCAARTDDGAGSRPVTRVTRVRDEVTRIGDHGHDPDVEFIGVTLRPGRGAAAAEETVARVHGTESLDPIFRSRDRRRDRWQIR
jgi:hypothetical protein